MNYVYGDSTASRLKSNVLEFFRDALDCSVVLLQADLKVKEGSDRIRALRTEADAELTQLDTFIGVVDRAIRDASAKTPESPTLQCAVRLQTLTAEARESVADVVRAKLASEITAVQAQEVAARETCAAALGTLLLGQTPPDGATVLRLALGSGMQASYEAKLKGQAEFGLEWSFDLTVPDGSPWASTVRIESLAPQLEIRAPQLAGWITKEVKIRPLKLDRHAVTELVDDGDTVSVKLRAEPGAEVGFDLEVDWREAKVKKITRVGPQDDASAGVFDVHAEDVANLVALVEKLRVSAAALQRRQPVTARFDEGEFREIPEFAVFVQRLVGMMAPIIREISDRSLTPRELVLRRLLGNDRREEVFVAKATLREKYAVLPEPLIRLFAPLGLDPAIPGSATVSARPTPLGPVTPTTRAASEPAPPRAELPPSRPPLPMPSNPPPLPARAQAITKTGFANVPPAPPSTPAVAPASRPTPVPGDSVEIIIPAAADSSSSDVDAKAKGVKSEALAAAMKKIVMLSRSGRIDESFEEYRALFASAAFTEYAPDDQRHALRQMVAAKAPAPPTGAVLEAHRAAIICAKALAATHGDPSDHEMVSLIKDVGAL